MASRHQVSCIKKSDRTSAYERIIQIGGTNYDNTRWSLAHTDAIKRIEDGTYEFYVKVNGREVEVIVSTSASGNKYLKTRSDGEQPNNLLSLPECS